MKNRYIFTILLLVATPLLARQDSSLVREPNLNSSPTLQVGSEYILGPGDVLSIHVYWGNTETEKNNQNHEVEVQPAGEIFMPALGEVFVSGLTLVELKYKLLELFKRIIRNPRVVVKVVQYVSHKVVVFGAARNGIYPLKKDTRITELLSSIGGLEEAADISNIRVSRKNGQMLHVNLLRLIDKNDVSQNIVLQPDDLILIPSVNENKVVVLGEVNSPGVVLLNGKLSLVEAVVKSGGVTRQAKLSHVQLIRFNKSKKNMYTINLLDLMKKKKATKIQMKPGDIVYVPGKRQVLNGINNVLRTLLPSLQTVLLVKTVM